MKKILVISAALLALSAPIAFGGGLDLAWNNCATTGGVQNIALPCVSGIPIVRAYGSFISDVPVTNFVACDITLDLQVDNPTLVPFWDFKTAISAASCNDGLSMTDDHDPAFSFGFCTSSLNPWGDALLGDPSNGAYGDVALGYVPNFGGSPNRGRIVGSVFRASNNPTDLVAGQSYVNMVLVLNAFRSDTRVPAGPCSGCATPAAIVWNQATLGTLAGASEAAVPITGPGEVSNCATAGGGTSLCGATPTQSKTWGALKSLYR